MQISPAEAFMPAGLGTALEALCLYSNDTVAECAVQAWWSTGDPGVAAVSNVDPGVVTADQLGDATIAATLDGVAGEAEIHVASSAAVEAVEIDPAVTLLGVGESLQYAATCVDGDTSQDCTAAATWTSSDPAVASVSNGPGSAGLVVGVGPGSATIAAAQPGVAGQASLVVYD